VNFDEVNISRDITKSDRLIMCTAFYIAPIVLGLLSGHLQGAETV